MSQPSSATGVSALSQPPSHRGELVLLLCLYICPTLLSFLQGALLPRWSRSSSVHVVLHLLQQLCHGGVLALCIALFQAMRSSGDAKWYFSVACLLSFISLFSTPFDALPARALLSRAAMLSHALTSLFHLSLYISIFSLTGASLTERLSVCTRVRAWALRDGAPLMALVLYVAYTSVSQMRLALGYRPLSLCFAKRRDDDEDAQSWSSGERAALQMRTEERMAAAQVVACDLLVLTPLATALYAAFVAEAIANARDECRGFLELNKLVIPLLAAPGFAHGVRLLAAWIRGRH